MGGLVDGIVDVGDVSHACTHAHVSMHIHVPRY